MSYTYDRRGSRVAAKLIRFPEGIMTEEEWVLNHAESVEAYTESWLSFFDRTKFNRMDGPQQVEYEKALKQKAGKPHFRAWKQGHQGFFNISKATYEAAKRKGIKVIQ
jgi:hypothetical protein